MSSYKCSCGQRFANKKYFMTHKRFYCKLKHHVEEKDTNPDLQDDRELRKEHCCFDSGSCKCHRYTNRYNSTQEYSNVEYHKSVEKKIRTYEFCTILTKAAFDFNDINSKLNRIQLETLIKF